MDYCDGHIKLCEDIATIKEKVTAIDKRINGSIDDIKAHIQHGTKWRLAIVGVTISLALTIVTSAINYGKLTAQVEDSMREIDTLRTK